MRACVETVSTSSQLVVSVHNDLLVSFGHLDAYINISIHQKDQQHCVMRCSDEIQTRNID